MDAEARRRAEEGCIKSSALTCVTHDWAPMVVCEQGLANALAQMGREREDEKTLRIKAVDRLDEVLTQREELTAALAEVHAALAGLMSTVEQRGDSWMMSSRTSDALTDIAALLTPPPPASGANTSGQGTQ